MLLEQRLDVVEQALEPRPVFAETAITGGRWRSREARRGCTSSSVDLVTSHFESTTSVEQPALRATSATARSCSTMPSLASTRTSATSARSAAAERAQLRVVLDPLPLLALAPQAGRVDEQEGAVVALQHRVDRVARRAGDVRDDHALLADERVQERRLAHVRAAEDGDADRLVAERRPALAREQRDDLVEQVAGAVAVQRRERQRVAEPEPVELERLEVARGSSSLFASTSTGFLRRAQDDGELLVARRDPVTGVDHEEDEVGLLDRRARLLRDLPG